MRSQRKIGVDLGLEDAYRRRPVGLLSPDPGGIAGNGLFLVLLFSYEEEPVRWMETGD